ncbi:sigma-54 dependent transcriptional regulator [Desulfosarcina ovata subsp. sediminis]|uniref:HTH-type transcriptional regulatory protein TyrR n=1 Tax=Desulfosarcina ovata subsp. sediminis TaxID=885957 RepID=A0A5K7ZY72_9BACT|nr:sigma 54-interacting transcriptional regulator [Desulfosarcina ovata]BBO85219.1 sigma-54 dependent transcriptional regulator [Desulfosarcina ovata subsp. sediminis]
MAEMNEITLHQVFESMNCGIIVMDRAGRIQWVNPQALGILKPSGRLCPGEAIGTHLPLTGRLVERCLKTGEPQLDKHLQGKHVDIVVHVTCMKASGKITGAVCSLDKIERFEEAASQLDSVKRLNRQLTAIVDNSSDGIWVCDGNGTVITVNKSSERLNGVKAEEVIGKHVSIMEDKGLVDHNVTPEVIRTGRKISALQYIKRTGKYVLMTATPVFDENGDISMVVSNGRDMTRLNAINEELEQIRMKAQKLEDRLAEIDMLQLKDQDIVAENDKMVQILRVAFKLAKMDASNILILGESGAGKGMLAKFIHKNGNRSKKAFIQINCAALPETLLEAELFGYEGGAFTGARQKGKAGLLELAHGGVLFLDEIGDMPISVQAKLLKYLDDHMVMRVGGTQARMIDCLIVAATNHDLEAKAKEKTFREDLYYRLNSFIIHIPPLRERPEDILKLANSFLKKYNAKYNLDRRLSYRTLEFLRSHPFEGNVRELQNLIRRLVVMGEPDASPATARDDYGEPLPAATAPPPVQYGLDPAQGLTAQLEAVEREILRRAFARFPSTRQMAAQLKVSQPTIVRKLKKYGLAGKDT